MLWDRLKQVRAPDGVSGSGGVVVDAPQVSMPLGSSTGAPSPEETKEKHGNGNGNGNGSSGQQQASGKNVVVPQAAMKRIKQEERERGRKEAVETLASELGYESVEEMREALRKPSNGKKSEEDLEEPEEIEEKQARPQDNKDKDKDKDKNGGNTRRDASKWERKLEQAQREREVMNRRLASEVKLRKELQRALDAKDAEMSLREAAVAAGVKDVDYAVRLLTKELEGQDEEALKAFDESKFFTGLKDSKPYLFGEQIKPATTGTGTGQAPPAPKPGQAAQDQARNGAVDAKKMSKDEFNAHLAKRGLSIGL